LRQSHNRRQRRRGVYWKHAASRRQQRTSRWPTRWRRASRERL